MILDANNTFTAILVVVVLVVLYFMPWLVAWRREHLNSAAIFIANLLLGWTLIGWIVCLVWAFTNQGQQTPPPPVSPYDFSERIDR